MFGLARQRPEPDDFATVLPLDRLIALRSEAARSRSSSQRGVTHMPGLAQTRLRGRGLDFDEMRPYAEGDDVRHIDWNVTARTGRPYTRLYREERERAVTVATDLRSSMFTGSRRLKAVVAGEYAASLLWRVAANQDRAGSLVFDDRGSWVSRPAARQRGVLEAVGLIARRFDEASHEGGDVPAQTLDKVLADINRLSRNAGLVLMLTDCTELGPDIDHELSVAGRRERLVVLRIADPIELDGLPSGDFAYRDRGRTATSHLSRADAERLRKELAERTAALESRFAAYGVPLLTISTDLPAGDLWSRLGELGVI